MKKVLLFVFANLIVGSCLAQHVWQSQDYEDAQKKFDEVSALYKKKGNKTWSKKLLETFPIASDKTIKHQCVIKSDRHLMLRFLVRLSLPGVKLSSPMQFQIVLALANI